MGKCKEEAVPYARQALVCKTSVGEKHRCDPNRWLQDSKGARKVRFEIIDPFWWHPGPTDEHPGSFHFKKYRKDDDEEPDGCGGVGHPSGASGAPRGLFGGRNTAPRVANSNNNTSYSCYSSGVQRSGGGKQKGGPVMPRSARRKQEKWHKWMIEKRENLTVKQQEEFRKELWKEFNFWSDQIHLLNINWAPKKVPRGSPKRYQKKASKQQHARNILWNPCSV